MCLVLRNNQVVTKGTPLAAKEAVHVARLDPDASEEHHHGRAEVLAVTRLSLEEKVLECGFAGSGGKLARIGEGLEPVPDRDSLVVAIVDAGSQ